MAAIGKHCILEAYDCPADFLNDEVFIAKVLNDAAQHGMSTLLDQTTRKFEPQGVTSLALLAESHISIHTWPEFGYAAVDAFTCGEKADPIRACEYILDMIQAGRHVLRVMDRGMDLPSHPGIATLDGFGAASASAGSPDQH